MITGPMKAECPWFILGSVGKLRRRPEREQFFRLTKTAKQAMFVLSSIQPDAGRRKKGRSKPDRAFRQSLVLCLVVLICSLGFSQAGGGAVTRRGLPDDTALSRQLELGPYVQYSAPSRARIHWWTLSDSASILEYGLAGPGAKHSPDIELTGTHQGRLEHSVTDPEPTRYHSLAITGLLPNEVYAYRVGAAENGLMSPIYQLDTALNYAAKSLENTNNPFETVARNDRIKTLARKIISRTGISRGYCLVWGITDGHLAYELAAHSQLQIIGLDHDAARVQEVRNAIYQTGAYGARIVIHHVEDLGDISFTSHFANLIVSERVLDNETCPGPAQEMLRVLQPEYGTAVLGSFTDLGDSVKQWLGSAAHSLQREDDISGAFFLVKKPSLPETGSWTHQYGDAGNTADSHDNLGGAAGTEDLQVQWLGNPGADFGIDRNPRMPAPLAVNGKLFHQGMNRMVAVDSYNGAVLWSLEIPDLRRVNLPRDASNWCTDQSSLYVAVKDKCWVLDHSSGDLTQVYALPPEQAEGDNEWGYIAQDSGVLLGTAVKKGTGYTNFWGGASWYDKTNGPGTEKVCSDMLFGHDMGSEDLLWQYENGVIINPAIGAASGHVFLVESRNNAIKQQTQRRLNSSGLWSDQFLVSLDIRTGAVQWEVPINTVAGTVVFFLCCTEDKIIISASVSGKYYLYGFETDTGQIRWKREHNWTSNNHSGHMQHPVVFEKEVFLEPWAYDLSWGSPITSNMGRHQGCATYCGTKNALIYRGQSRRISMWDIKQDKVSSWYNLRPSCWLSTIAADGMVILPEGGAGCSCGNWLETSLTLLSVKPVTPPRRRQ